MREQLREDPAIRRRVETGLGSAIWAIFLKDWRSEWRTRAALNAILLFSLACPVALGYSLARQKLPPEALGGLLWIVLFFAALVGLPRAFVKEEESGTSALLRLHFPAEAVLWGKVLGQLSLLAVTQLAAVPLFVVLLGAKIHNVSVLLAVLVLGDIGLAVASCLLAAMAAQARSRGTLFCAIAAPLLLPLLVTAAGVTGAAFGARLDVWPSIQVLCAFDMVVVAAAWMLWEFVWN